MPLNIPLKDEEISQQVTTTRLNKDVIDGANCLYTVEKERGSKKQAG